MRLPPLLSVAVSCLVVFPVSGAELRGDRPDAPALSPEEQLKRFKVPPGFEVQLVAAEPEIQKPININFDAAGRLWVTGSQMYPWPAATDAVGNELPGFAKVYEDIANAFGSRGKAPEIQITGQDTARILSDFDATGRARKVEIFADKLNIPTGIQPLPRTPGAKGDTAIVYSIPNIWRFEDTDGDGKADRREPLYEGFGYLDTHGMSSNYIHWIDGWIYGCHGFRNRSEVKDRNGNVTVFESGNTYRFKPDGSKIEYFTHGQTNPFGLAFDPQGNLYSADSHSKPIYMLIRGGYYEGIGKQHDGLGFAPRITDDDHGSSAIAGIMYYADDKWPAEFHGNLFNGNPVTNRVNRAKLDWNGSSPKATRLEDFVVCDDPWFRPVQVKLGPDGAMYIADFYNPIIGHYEVPLNDPRRDRKHGRIWRVVWKGEGNSTGTPGFQGLENLDTPDLVDTLAHPNLEVRRLATHEIINRERELAAGDTLPAHRLRIAWEHGTATQRFHAFNIIATLEARKPGGELDAENVGQLIKDADPLIASAALSFLSGYEVVLESEIASGLTAAAANRAEDALIQGKLSQLIARHPTQLGLSTLVRRLADQKPDSDPELAYARRVALREVLRSDEGYTWAKDLREDQSIRIVADVSLAVPTWRSADFIAGYLEQTQFSTQRSSEYLRHVILHAREPEQVTEMVRKISGLHDASLKQRVSLAHAIVDSARTRKLPLSESTKNWVHATMSEALEATDPALLDLAIAAVRDEPIETKAVPLKKLIFNEGSHGPRRAAALEALMNLPVGIETAAAALADPSSLTLRKKAAVLLAQKATAKDTNDGEIVRAALLAALPTAPAELAATIAVGLALSDSGAEQLLAVVEAGKVSASILRNNWIQGVLAQRSDVLRKRAAELTAGLPPEDVRLNSVIAKRVDDFRAGKHDPVRGEQLFQQQCAACHKLRNTGGNVGPNLDGIASRGIHRIIEDILDSNRNVDPAFRQTLIETTDGRLIAGVNVRTDGDLVVLNDATGQEQRVSKSEIRSQRHSPLSLMPATFEQTLPGKDLLDLVGYLVAPPEQK